MLASLGVSAGDVGRLVDLWCVPCPLLRPPRVGPVYGSGLGGSDGDKSGVGFRPDGPAAPLKAGIEGDDGLEDELRGTYDGDGEGPDIRIAVVDIAAGVGLVLQIGQWVAGIWIYSTSKRSFSAPVVMRGGES